jgi:hypothetical protein
LVATVKLIEYKKGEKGLSRPVAMGSDTYWVKDGIRLLKDQNPWGLTDLEFTVFCLRFLLKRTSRETAQILFEIKDLEKALNRVNNIVGVHRNSLIYDRIDGRRNYSARVLALPEEVWKRSGVRQQPTTPYEGEWVEILEEIGHTGPISLPKVTTSRKTTQAPKEPELRVKNKQEDEPSNLNREAMVIFLANLAQTRKTEDEEERLPLEPQEEKASVPSSAARTPNSDPWVESLLQRASKNLGRTVSAGTFGPRGTTTPRSSYRGSQGVGGCPRCGGSMIQETDWYGTYSSCISCGHVKEHVSKTALVDLEDDGGERLPGQRRRQPSHGKIKL